MTYTILTTHTLGGEIEIGFHRKADGTAYAIAAQLTQAAEIIEAQEKRRQAGLSFSPYEAHKEVLRAAEDFDELRTIMEARS
jgi:hypothetical protein